MAGGRSDQEEAAGSPMTPNSTPCWASAGFAELGQASRRLVLGLEMHSAQQGHLPIRNDTGYNQTTRTPNVSSLNATR